MARCPDCNKFVSYEEMEPEVEVDVQDGIITGSVRIVNACSECGGELKEASLDVEETLPGWEEHVKMEGEHQLEFVEDPSAERQSFTEGKGRGIKTFYGAEATFRVACTCGNFTSDIEWKGSVQASHMEQMY